MGDLFDISVERLMGVVPGGGSAPAPQSHPGRIERALEGGPYRGFGETQDPGTHSVPGAPEENTRERPQGSGTRPALQGGRTFYLETFGCQMNEHDSEKVAGVLLARGYRQVESPEVAAVILYNTCSIREKAAQKVYSRLGEFRPGEEKSGEWRVESGEQEAIAQGEKRPLQAMASGGKIIGVLGCLAQQEGQKIFARAPWVSLVCGSASYR